MDIKKYINEALTHEAYIADFEARIAEGTANEYHTYLAQNWQRTIRIPKTLKINETFATALANKTTHHTWLVISEPWCGDASQIVPVLNAIAAQSNGTITLKIVLRDANLELMDMHLTNGGRAIPKLLIINDEDTIVTTWGPRPAAAQALIIEVKADPVRADNYQEHLHTWYAKDKQQTLLQELIKLL